MRDQRLDEIQAQINHLDNIKRILREREADLEARSRYLDQPQTYPAGRVQSLRGALLQTLPGYMMPGNVGGINEVIWPFLFQVNVDIGTDPTVIDTLTRRNFFQVDQESALLLMAISRAHNTDAAGISATVNSPLQIDLKDRQSSRQFSSEPIPLQAIGFNACPSKLPTPMYLQPNAFLDVTTSGIPATGQSFTGSGSFQLSFFGYRIRTEDTGKVLSTIFQMP